MKRKIAAILAADAVGYSRLVAEDEEDTLARLASYRGVFGDFVTRFGGRIFNTAGDAILAEFESAVDAVRCAVDVQESLRARNLAYTPSRQMSFRIGITIGDVVERDGDLLGDGVNVAARLESVAPDGGICISRSVYEVVANKVSLEFSDRGEQHLKNIPDPVHAYTFAPDVSSKNRKQASRLASLVTRHWTVFAAVMVVLAGIAGFMFVGREQSVQSVKPPPAPATEASLPSEVEPDVESADSSSPPAEGTPASPPAARAPQASTVSPEGTTSSGASRDIAESAAGNEPKTTKNVDVGCKKFFPAIGKTLTVPCGVDASQGVPQSGAAPEASTVSPDGATSNGASRDTAESPAQETESSGERLTLTARLGKKTIEGQTRTVLGVRIQSLDDRLRSCFDVKKAKGAVVQEVSPESPAKDAGLQSGDIIQELDGKAIVSAGGLAELVAAEPGGVTVKLDVLRSRALKDGAQELKDRAGTNDAAAMACLGYFHEAGIGAEKDVAEANRWYRKAAEAGHSWAMTNLALNLENGDGISKDVAEANRWYRKAAEASDPKAMTNLALNLENGNGISKDVAEANRWYRKAADEGEATAIFKLALMYAQGRGVEKDEAQAARWYRKAADKGNAQAMHNLAWRYAFGTGVAKDEAQALRWYRKAADKGHATAIYRIGWMYARGRGVAKDEAEAVRWYRKAAAKGEAGAMNNLGWMYANGRGVAKDEADAVYWYRNAAEKGNSDAMHSLGAAYEVGAGVGKDPRQAAEWVFKAVKAGNDFSIKQMNENASAYTKQFRREFQRLLRDAGVYEGRIDGSFGPGVRRAIEALPAAG